MAMVCNGKAELLEYGTKDFQPEIKKGNLFYVSMGSGQILADPFLAFVSRVLWKDTLPTVKMAKIGVFWVLSHTVKHAAGGVGLPLKLAVLQKVGIDWKTEILDDTQEQSQFIAALEASISQMDPLAAAPATQPPPAPPAA